MTTAFYFTILLKLILIKVIVMNKTNKELLDRALIEGVKSTEDFNGNGLVLSFFKNAGDFYFVNPTDSHGWVDVCTKEEYLAAKAEKENRKTVSEYDIGCYYEFSDFTDFNCIKALRLSKIFNNSSHHYIGHDNNSYKYIRPLTAKAGEIRKPKTLSGFINVYENGALSGVFSDKIKAIAQSGSGCIACIDLSQFNEGEGL